MFKSRSTLILAGCMAVAVCTVLLKYYYPSFLYYHTSLLLILLLTIFIKSDFYTYIFGVFAVLMIFLSLKLDANAPSMEGIIKQVSNIFIAVIIMFVVLYIKKLYRSLDKEKRQMNALFEFARESIILTNSKGEIIFGNSEAQRLFGYAAIEMVGKQFEMLLPERFHVPLHRYRNEIINPASEHVSLKEMYALKKNGYEFPVEITLNSYEQQDELFILTFIGDLSQHKEAENRFIDQKTQLEKITHDVRIMNIELENKVAERTLILQEALQELEKSQTELSDALNKEKELNEIKSRFVSMASHEFRTPLSTILSSASLLSKYQLYEEQASREKHIRRIKDSVKHLNDMLEDFLNLGKIEEGRVFTQVVEFDVKEFLQDVFDEMKISLKIGQQLKLSFEGENFFATDKRLLKNILINLLSNAIKFSEIHKTIEISVDNSITYMILQIKDQGIGIAKEDMPHLFSTFYRGKNAVNIQGTGLGLHIVKRYVDMLEGSITLSTELNEGTTFNVGLPNLKELV
jgi:PAS domain S-box-containing protein